MVVVMLRNSILISILFVVHGSVLGMDEQKDERETKIKAQCEQSCADLIEDSVQGAEFKFDQGIVVTMKKVVDKPFDDVDKKYTEDKQAIAVWGELSKWLVAHVASSSSSVSHSVATTDANACSKTVNASSSISEQQGVVSVNTVSDDSQKERWAVYVSHYDDSPHVVAGDYASAYAYQGDVMGKSCCCVQ